MVKKLSVFIERLLIWQVKRLIRSRRPKIVAVTGSVGKTSTKLAIAHLLSGKYEVRVNRGNYNSPIGLPLAIFDRTVPKRLTNPLAWFAILWANERLIRQRQAADEVWVLEMGAERKGEIAYFMRYIKPDIGVVTAARAVHMEDGQFRSVDEILDEKWQLALSSRAVLANSDDSRLAKKLIQRPGAHGFGLESGDYRFEQLKFASQGFEGQLKLSDKTTPVKGGLIARHTLYALAAAAAVADFLELTPGEIADKIESYRPPPGRMRPLKGKYGSLVIDDTYNASPDAVMAALSTLYSLSDWERKIAILGSMNELGRLSRPGHRAVGIACGKLDLLVTIGEVAAEHLAPAAAEAGLATSKIRSFSDPFKAGEFVAANLKSHDAVLVKGSQNGVFAEEAVKYLLAERSNHDQLVRQSPAWIERKRRAFGLK